MDSLKHYLSHDLFVLFFFFHFGHYTFSFLNQVLFFKDIFPVLQPPKNFLSLEAVPPGPPGAERGRKESPAGSLGLYYGALHCIQINDSTLAWAALWCSFVPALQGLKGPPALQMFSSSFK